MPRQSKSEIEAQLADDAATLFARHGFANTSLQQIADVTGYSKAGLLHHFPSKEAIFRAAMQAGRDVAQRLLDQVSTLPVGPERDRAIIEASVDVALTRPGLALFLDGLAHDDTFDDPELTEIGMTMLAVYGIDPHDVDHERIVRVTSASAGLTAASRVALRADMRREWRDRIIAAAMNTLGHVS